MIPRVPLGEVLQHLDREARRRVREKMAVAGVSGIVHFEQADDDSIASAVFTLVGTECQYPSIEAIEAELDPDGRFGRLRAICGYAKPAPEADREPNADPPAATATDAPAEEAPVVAEDPAPG